ncbi:TetR family transcriptional regulator [Komagataeibacter europaeus]|uniref:TetR family transcriptional regulator n=1 Tax=Komagataeibacter europaeus TaxID=33995 RepID=UPI0002E23830|nr:TetR family transcriptional regulator [Komagataeibacter europaeus]
MSASFPPSYLQRKQPKQARSTRLVETILAAASRVLEEEGVERFTTARVAEYAGISIGSLYQYFPSKAAILYRLQTDEWRDTAELTRSILQDHAHPPFTRLRKLVRAFLQSECNEAEMRTALYAAAPFFCQIANAQKKDSDIGRFLTDAFPEIPAAGRTLAAELIEVTLKKGGESFSETTRSAQEIIEYSDAMADMFEAYLKQLCP